MADTSKQIMKADQGKGLSGAESWRPFDMLRRQADRLFDDWETSMFSWPLGRSRMAMPVPSSLGAMDWPNRLSVDVAETADAFEVKADLPGFDEKSVDVSLINGSLKISAQRDEEKEEKDKDYYLHERQSGRFERTFTLPDSVDRDKIEARFKNGVLMITLPKTPEARVPEKKIQIKAA